MSVIITAVATRAPKDEVVAQLTRKVAQVSRLVAVAPGAGASTKAQARLLGDDICTHLSHFSGMDLGDFNEASRNLGDEGFGAAQYDAAQYGAAACYPASAGRWLSSIGAVSRDTRDAEAEQQFFAEARGAGEQMRTCSRAVDKVFGAMALAVDLVLEAPLRLLKMTLGTGLPPLLKAAAEMAVAGLRAAAEAVKDAVETVRAILGRVAECIDAAACQRPAPPVGYEGETDVAEGAARCTRESSGDGTGGAAPTASPAPQSPGPAGSTQAVGGAHTPVAAADAGTAPAAAPPQAAPVSQAVQPAPAPAASAAATLSPAAGRGGVLGPFGPFGPSGSAGSAGSAARAGAAPARAANATSYERLCRCSPLEVQAPRTTTLERTSGAVEAPGWNAAEAEPDVNPADGSAVGDQVSPEPAIDGESRGLTITFDFTLEATVNASLGCLDDGVAELFRAAGTGEGLRAVIGPWAQSGAAAVMGGIEHMRNRIHEILACAASGGGEPPAPPATLDEPCPAPPPVETVPAQQQVAAPPPELARVPEPAQPAEKVAHVAAQGAGEGGQVASPSTGPEPALSSGSHARIEGNGSATWGIKKAGQW